MGGVGGGASVCCTPQTRRVTCRDWREERLIKLGSDSCQTVSAGLDQKGECWFKVSQE